MRFIVEREKLFEAVTNLSRAIANRATFPVLEGIYMEASNEGLKMTAYNLEIGMTKTIDITCAEEGKIVIKAKLLADILRSLLDDTISFEVNERLICKIKSGSTVFDIMGMPAEDFPEIPIIDDCERIVLPCDVLKDMVRKTIFATASSETQKPILTGLFFEILKDKIIVIGVDGYRLAVRKEKINLNKELSFIVSAKTIGEVVKIITDNDENIEFFIGKRYVAMSVNGYSIISRKIEGEFIDYKKIMPSEFSTTAKINTKELSSAIERISLIINDQLKTPMRCNIKKDEILFSCATALGRAADSYKTTVTGDEFEIGINNRFLLDAIKACETDEAIINMNGPYSSVIILPVEGDDFIYMVMPMRLKAE